MKKKIWQEEYKIASYLVNLRGQAGLYAVLNLIQDVGWLHAIHLQVKLPKNLGWIFTRQKLLMTEWPAWNTEISVRTWLRRPEHEAFLFRDYEILMGDRKIGECTSTFTVLDMSTRKMAAQDWSEYSEIWRDEGYLAHLPAKIQAVSEVTDLAKFEVRNSDIDLNNHVNNTKYAQWILDAIPIDVLRKGTNLHEYEVNFLSETKIGDIVQLQKALKDESENDSKYVHFQGTRMRDGKPAFTARMKITENIAEE